MAAQLFVVLGQMAYRFAATAAGRKAAQALVKQLGKKGGSGRNKARITKNRPANAKVVKGPNVGAKPPKQPTNPKSGQFQSPKPSPAIRKPTTPKVSTPKKPASPSATVKKPKVPAKIVKKPTSLKTTSPKKPTVKTPKPKPPIMPKSMVKNRTNFLPKKTSRPAVLRDLARPDAPEIDTKPAEDKKKKQQDRKFVPRTSPYPATKTSPPKKNAPPKKDAPTKKDTKKPKKDPTLRPKARPSTSTMSLREYLNKGIAKRSGSLTKEKAKGKKHKSIAAAKKAGDLYYTNKDGKIMAAVYKEDLKIKK
jgi:hypothetical protein